MYLQPKACKKLYVRRFTRNGGGSLLGVLIISEGGNPTIWGARMHIPHFIREVALGSIR